MSHEHLTSQSMRELRATHKRLTRDIATVQRQLERNALASSITRHRAKRLASDTLIGCRLDQRIEQLFDSIRKGRLRIPAPEVVQVIDGLIARTISRRIWIGAIATLTILPAVASLVLLGIQNKTMIQKLEAEEAVAFQTDREEFLTILQANRIRWVGTGQNRTLENFNAYHRHVRSGAMLALIALEKQRWNEEERKAIPTQKYIDLRNGEFGNLFIGGHLSLTKGTPATDLTQVRFDGSDFTKSHIYNVWLDGSSFRNCTAEDIKISSPSARHTNFSGMLAQGAELSWDPKTSEPFHIENSTLDQADFSNGKFIQVFMVRCSLNGTNLAGVHYDMANFAHCDLTSAQLGNADFSKGLNALHECLVTQKQSTMIKLPSYCRYEKTSDPDVLKIVMDLKGYEAARANHPSP